MISIVGTRIYMHEGESFAFRAMYKERGRLVDFDPTFILKMNIKDRESKSLILSKLSESLDIGGKDSQVFIFGIDEPITKGDYLYDIIVETTSGSTQTSISNAPLHILECTHDNMTLDPVLGDEFIPHRLESLDYTSISLYTTPLICDYKYVKVEKKLSDSEGTLILFGANNIEEDDEEDSSDINDTLIVF